MYESGLLICAVMNTGLHCFAGLRTEVSTILNWYKFGGITAKMAQANSVAPILDLVGLSRLKVQTLPGAG